MTCAQEGERALDCGAAPSPGRQQSCCNGFSCKPGNVKVTCTANENLPQGPTCGKEGVKATSCGAAPAANRPEGCCSGFVCHPGPQKVFCTDARNVTSPSTTKDGTICAANGERARACGATGAGRPAGCCPGMMCEFGAGVRCVVDPFAPTAKPTKRPTTVSTAWNIHLLFLFLLVLTGVIVAFRFLHLYRNRHSSLLPVRLLQSPPELTFSA